MARFKARIMLRIMRNETGTRGGDLGDDTFIGGDGRAVFQFRSNDRLETIQNFRQDQYRIEIVSDANAFAAFDKDDFVF